MVWGLLFFSFISFATEARTPNCVYDLKSGRPYTAPKLMRDSLSELKPLTAGLIEPQWPEIKFEGRLAIEHGVRYSLPFHFDLRENVLSISHSYFTDGAMIEGATAFKAEIQHQLSHLVFLVNMARRNEDWARHYASLTAKPGLLARIFNFSPRPKAIIDLGEPYQEFFADLLPAVALRQENVMASTVKHIAANPIARGHRFENPESHDLFEQTRSYLWHHYFSQEKNFGKESEMVTIIFAALADEICERAGDDFLQDLTPDQMNIRLIKSLREKLQAYR